MKTVKISDLFKIEKGTLQSSKNITGNYNFITAAEKWKTHNSFTHELEALIFAMAASGSLGRTHYVNGKFIASDLCYILTPSIKYSSINLKLYQMIFNFLREDIVKKTATGTSKLAINRNNFGDYELPYFDEKQQAWYETISLIKDKQDTLYEQTAIQKDSILKLRTTIVNLAIQGKLVPQDQNDKPAAVLLKEIQEEKEKLLSEGKIRREKKFPPLLKEELPYSLPTGWKWCRLQDVGILQRGKSKHRPRNDFKLFKDGIYPLIQTGDVSKAKYNKGLITNYTSKYNDFGLNQSKLWNKGTLCITIAANIAETGFLNFDACFPDSIVGLITKEHTVSRYVQFFLEVTKSKLEDFAPSTAQKNINLDILNSLLFPLPPLQEQKRIVEKVDELLTLCDNLDVKIKESQKNTDLLMQAVIQESFNKN